MFTGIIEERGRVLALDAEGDSARITVEAPLAVSDARHGDSISVAACASRSSRRRQTASPPMSCGRRS